MAFVRDAWAQSRTEQFRRMAIKFREMALEIDEEAYILDDSAEACDCCGTTRYRNFAQKQLRDRVVGASTSLTGIAAVLEQKARDPEFVGVQSATHTAAK